MSDFVEDHGGGDVFSVVGVRQFGTLERSVVYKYKSPILVDFEGTLTECLVGY